MRILSGMVSLTDTSLIFTYLFSDINLNMHSSDRVCLTRGVASLINVNMKNVKSSVKVQKNEYIFVNREKM